MSTFADSYVSRVLFASPAPGRVFGATARRWRRLTTSMSDPYRPELHYMRGPVQNGEPSMHTARGAQARSHSSPIISLVNCRTHREEPHP